MSQNPVCGFCGRECLPEEEIGLTFPDMVKRPVHLNHTGVKEEYESQNTK